MKKCPNCGAQMNDDGLFCTECGKPISQGNVCPHCGALVNDGDVFCQSCGRKVDESPSTEMTDSTQKKCAHCGSPINDDDAFCQSCGSPLNGVTISQTTAQVTLSCDEEEAPTDYKKIIIPIVIGLIVLILIGGGWYGYKEYSAYTEKKIAREKFVADSLEQVRRDSIKLAEQKEKERVEAEKISAMRDELSWERVFALMKNIKNQSLAQKCGLEEIYKYEYYQEGEDEEPAVSYDIEIYGREVKKGTVTENGGYASVDIISNSDHSCYLEHVCASDCGYTIAFKDNEDADYFFNKVTENGVIISNESFLIPKKSTFKGIRESDNWEFEDIAYGMSKVQYSEGWYVIYFNPY